MLRNEPRGSQRAGLVAKSDKRPEACPTRLRRSDVMMKVSESNRHGLLANVLVEEQRQIYTTKAGKGCHIEAATYAILFSHANPTRVIYRPVEYLVNEKTAECSPRGVRCFNTLSTATAVLLHVTKRLKRLCGSCGDSIPLGMWAFFLRRGLY